ncbi:MAG: glycosyltransferase family 4 protein [Acidobacteriota bacterium]|nr:glycosyltransferase family 4 protein [Acidobacteriota bacterium]
MSTILIDATYAVDPHPTGVSVYSRGLIQALSQLPTNHKLIAGYRLSRWRRRKEFIRFDDAGKAGLTPVTTRFFQNPWTFWLRWQAGLFHSLAQRPAPFRFAREVTTILDVFPLSGRGYCSPGFARKFSALLVEASERAGRIITPSQYTADELVRHTNADPGNIRVIPLGVTAAPPAPPGFDAAAERGRWAGSGNELVLVVGVIQTRKNTLGALKALERLPENYKMALVGGDGYGCEPVHDYIRKNNLGERVIVPGYVDPPTMDRLYRSASVLFFPSLEEGFGLPVLEAMAHGLPAVVSHTSCLPEVGGEAALYTDPLDPADMAEKVRMATENLQLRNQMIQKGIKRASEFTWQRVAEATLAVYNELLAL